jgi:hypothetical protein
MIDLFSWIYTERIKRCWVRAFQEFLADRDRPTAEFCPINVHPALSQHGRYRYVLDMDYLRLGALYTGSRRPR